MTLSSKMIKSNVKEESRGDSSVQSAFENIRCWTANPAIART